MGTVAYQRCEHCGVEFRGNPSPRTREENAFILLSDHMKAAHADLLFTCGRQLESPMGLGGPAAFWEADKTCSYCGSLSQERFFELVEDGAEVGPTDKGYKAYVTHQDVRHAKFYFQHLDEAGRDRFITLVNERKMKIGFPGHFYVLPYFCARAPKPTE